jgi:hypothetical protein
MGVESGSTVDDRTDIDPKTFRTVKQVRMTLTHECQSGKEYTMYLIVVRKKAGSRSPEMRVLLAVACK